MPLALPTTSAPSRRFLPLLRSIPRIGALSLVATVGLTALPVAGGGPQAKPRPVKPKVVGLAMGSQPSRAATAADGAEPFADGPMRRSDPAADTIVSVGDGAPLVGVTWARGTAPEQGTEISLRGKTGDGWTEWITVDVLAVSDPTAAKRGTTQRVGTDPAWLGEGVTAVQVRYRSTDHQAVRKGRLELVDPGTSPADAPASTPPASAAAIAARPRIISRAGWGADESMKRCGPDYGKTTNGGFLHHTAGTNNYTASQSAALVRGIYAYHVNGQGWCDIGYNFLVDKYGQVFEGRYGGVDRPVLGAHTLGFNTDTFGVSVLGNYGGSTQPSSAALSAVTAVMSWRLAIYYRPGNGSTTYVSGDSGSRYPEGTRIVRPVIMGHRDVVNTSCPGVNLWNKLNGLRSSVASREGYTSSVVYKRWIALGGANGPLGVVASGEKSHKYGVRTIFANGNGLWQTPTGVRQLSHVFAGYYDVLGGPERWGYPVRDSYASAGGQLADLSGGTTLTWAPGVGTRYIGGPIKSYWVGEGGPAGDLRYPTSNQVMSGTRAGQVFQDGRVYQSSATGTHATLGAIDDYHAELGGWDSELRMPVQDQVSSGARLGQVFEGGRIYQSATTGTHATLGAIDDHHADLGGWNSWLGLPTEDQKVDSSGITQQFEGGWIHYDPDTGEITTSRG